MLLPDKTLVAKVISGSDFFTMGATVVDIDARVISRGDDGTNLDFQYAGKIPINESLLAIFSGAPSNAPGLAYISPRITSNSERFSWVNDKTFVGIGEISSREQGVVEIVYHIYWVLAQ